MARPSDPLFDTQWHFDLIGDIETIWNDYAGRGVTVGVYDDGVEYTHPDLAANYDPTLHFTDSGGTTYDPMTTTSVHGTAVAGLLGATAMNDAGGVGVAPGVMMTGVNFVGDIQFQPDAETLSLEAFAWAGNFDIMNNSWGEAAGYGYLLKFPYGPSFFGGEVDPEAPGSLADPTSRASAWHDAYAGIAATGRDGLGTLIVQAAGNDARNANGYALNASRFTITVGSTDATGAADAFSNWGTSLLLSAPAASVTTDLSGSNGVNTNRDDGDYFDGFSGTSAATPLVSGVISLMLEANDALGWRDVQTILATSAALTGSTYGGAASGLEISNWDSNGASNWNGGGMSFHFNYGFGMVDAFAAVRMAEAWSRFHSTPQTSANEQHVSASYGGDAVAIPDDSAASGTAGTPAEIDLVVSENIEIESIAVKLGVTHARAVDTVFSLVAPDGTEIPFLVREGEEYVYTATFESGDALMENGFEWTFEVTAFRGMSTAGTWTLKVEDYNADGKTGQIDGFSLDFYGASASVNDVHHFTDDFLELRSAEPGRGTISDTNGGKDWLNLVAVSGPVTLDLEQGTLSVDGAAWASIAAGSAIENAAAGDGNDVLAGNGLSNTLRGGRGDDRISGGDKVDWLYGEKGHDSLYGDAGKDRMWGAEGNDFLDGGKGGDRAWGNGGKDSLYGRGGNDLLLGGWGDDRLVGGWGADVLDGSRGADVLQGGRGADVFVIAPGDGSDLIKDFEDGIDRLDLTGFGFANEASALAAATQVGSAVEFALSGNDVLRILSVTVADLAGDILV
ncbi:S8 family serine peptidase [Tropicimonas sediminicola]|uniref:Hemolysin-type calcium-binding repeat-containing protein n=1 Tax=Tropicimonas sediminicola TaxID=1031541 RepID=A0A239FXT8_9RHOB|nr:S8 family serine peptidase [Tropicimonas sediminicola]SNS60594.1 Hemolysin-type calcium-binding repeat-containing protein [Tropicimonas sediminicola]